MISIIFCWTEFVYNDYKSKLFIICLNPRCFLCHWAVPRSSEISTGILFVYIYFLIISNGQSPLMELVFPPFWGVGVCMCACVRVVVC